MKILITGRPGTGKSHITEALAARGETAYDLETVPGVVRLEIKATGESVDWPSGYVDWDIYAWNLQETALRNFLQNQKAERLFASISATNQERFYHLFDKVIALAVDDPDEHTKRLTERNVHEHGQDEANIRKAVENYPVRMAAYLAAGAVAVNNMRPADEVVNEILTLCDDDR